jgi:hypothetical protein
MTRNEKTLGKVGRIVGDCFELSGREFSSSFRVTCLRIQLMLNSSRSEHIHSFHLLTALNRSVIACLACHLPYDKFLPPSANLHPTQALAHPTLLKPSDKSICFITQYFRQISLSTDEKFKSPQSCHETIVQFLE